MSQKEIKNELKFLETNKFIGKGDTFSGSIYKGFMPGQKYRLYIQNPNWENDKVTVGYWPFSISVLYTGDSEETVLIKVLKGEEILNYYDFTLENRAIDKVTIGGRANIGIEVIYKIKLIDKNNYSYFEPYIEGRGDDLIIQQHKIVLKKGHSYSILLKPWKYSNKYFNEKFSIYRYNIATSDYDIRLISVPATTNPAYDLKDSYYFSVPFDGDERHSIFFRAKKGEEIRFKIIDLTNARFGFPNALMPWLPNLVGTISEDDKYAVYNEKDGKIYFPYSTDYYLYNEHSEYLIPKNSSFSILPKNSETGEYVSTSVSAICFNLVSKTMEGIAWSDNAILNKSPKYIVFGFVARRTAIANDFRIIYSNLNFIVQGLTQLTPSENNLFNGFEGIVNYITDRDAKKEYPKEDVKFEFGLEGAEEPNNRYKYVYDIKDTLQDVLITINVIDSPIKFKFYISIENYDGYLPSNKKWNKWNDLDDNLCLYFSGMRNVVKINFRKKDGSTITDSETEQLKKSLKIRLFTYEQIDYSDINILNPFSEIQPLMQSMVMPTLSTTSKWQTPPCVLLHMSDVHNNGDNVKRIIKFFNTYKSVEYRTGMFGKISDIINTGDNVSDHAVALDGSEVDYTWWGENGGEIILNTLGNHDSAKRVPAPKYYDWRGFSKIDCYRKYFKPFISKWEVTPTPNAESKGFNYYYKDYSDSKVRLIVLDCMFYDDEQNTWLKQRLLEANSNDLTVVIAIHVIPDEATPVKTAYDYYPMPFWGSDYPLPNAVKAVKEFIDSGGDFAAWLAGHNHYDKFGTLKGDNRQTAILVASSGVSSYKESPFVPGTRSQDNFNIISIDKVNHIIKLAKIGCQYDVLGRKYDTMVWDYKTMDIK